MNLKFFIALSYSCLIAQASESDPFPLSPTGYFIGDVEHWTDLDLAQAIADLLKREQAQTVVDFGCGHGAYVNFFINKGFSAVGYDGNPVVEQTSGGTCFVQDLSISIDLNKKFDWVISLEVGEHLPPQYEKIFIENLIRHAKDKLILSWSPDIGWCHFNIYDNAYIKSLMSELGWENDISTEYELRTRATTFWFKDTVMVFRKKK